MNTVFALLFLYVLLLGIVEFFRRIRSLLSWLLRRHGS